MAGKAKADRSCGNQLYSRDILGDPNFVTNVTTKSDSGMHGLPLCLVLMTGSAFRGVGVFIECNWVYVGDGWHPQY